MLGLNALSALALSALTATAPIPSGTTAISSSGEITVSGQALIKQANPVLGFAPMSGGALSDNGRFLPFQADPRTVSIKGSGDVVPQGSKLAKNTTRITGAGEIALGAGIKSSGAPAGITKQPVLGFAPMSGGALSDNVAGTAAAQSNRFVIISDGGWLVTSGQKIGLGALRISSAGDIVLGGSKANVLGHDARVEGAGEITVSGRVSTSFVRLQGAGEIRLGVGIKTAKGTVIISGAGDVRVQGPPQIVMIGPIVPIFTRATFFAPLPRAQIRTLAPTLFLPSVT